VRYKEGNMDTTMCPTLGERDQDRLAFLALPAKRASEQVTGTANDLFIAIQKILNQILNEVCGQRTAEEFCAIRDLYFPQYMQVMKALGHLVQTVVPSNVIDRLCYESMSEMEASFREDGRAAFGQEMSDQALFTVWTLRKINDLVDGIRASKEPKKSLAEADAELRRMFVHHVLYSRFHLDCLNQSLRSGRILFPEVLDPISEGLRGLVNAYAYIRQASDLRSDRVDEEAIHIDFDDEEKELVALSMKDLVRDANL
jgi:hypothetical protein